MKKLMLTLAAGAAMAFGAKADFSVDELTKNLPANWGYATEGLGSKGDEVALVFTNTAPSKAMSFKLPDFVHEVRYLVVGGGGAGGSSGNGYAGGGGGAGGVVQNATPMVVAGGETVTAVVGVGSPKVSGDTHGGNGDKSTLTIGDTTFTAYRGAGGGAGNKDCKGYGNNADSMKTDCGGGAGANYGSYNGGVGFISNGGSGSNLNGGGGGGAGGKGYDWDASSNASMGGPGVATTIFDDTDYYIAGGGSGCPSDWSKVDGPIGGGGFGNRYNESYGTKIDAGDGTTWGAGGGGAGSSAKSGAGHQGVVVVRFSTTASATVPVTVPVIASKAYTGETLTADIADTDEYVVTANAGGVNVGTYDVVLHLKDHEPPYAWQDDGSAEDRTLRFEIVKAPNGWLTAPSLSKTAWEFSDDPAEAVPGVSKDGKTAVIRYDDGSEVMSLEPGQHKAIFTVDESDNYEKLETEIAFTIEKDTNVWTVEPSVTPDTWVRGEKPGVFAEPAAKYGEVTVVYDDNPALLEPDTTSVASHKAVWTVEEGDTWKGLSKTVTYTVTKKINGWVTAPVVMDGNIEDGVPAFTPPTAISGEVTAYYDGDKSIVEPPTAMGNHTVTYAVAEDEDEDGYQGYTQTIGYQVTYKPVVDPNDPSVVYGYRLPKLGEGGNEVALVFTNTAVTMAYTLPKYVTEISYLVVGGGAGGGASGNTFGAGGGGAGGVCQNSGPCQVSAGASILVAVGAGGSGIVSTISAKSGNGGDGQASSLLFDETELVALPGGGGAKADADGKGGATEYACGGGAGGNYDRPSDPERNGGEGALFNGGNGKGGGGGGAGAGGAGYAYNAASNAHVGGPGVVTTIFTDEEQTIAGGGCGTNGRTKTTNPIGGGGSSGSVDSYSNFNAGDGTTWGAGGGAATGPGDGKGHYASSGAGHQGVVVVRYVEAANIAIPPTVPSKVYTGEQLVAEPFGGQGWVIVANEGGVDVAQYYVRLGLKEGYTTWDGGTDGEINLAFEITPAENDWAVLPAISKVAWLTTDEPGELTAGATKFGKTAATIVKDDGEAEAFDGTLPAAAGRYVITYAAPTSDNWTYAEDVEMKKSVSFEIVNGDVVPPFAVTVDAIGVTQRVGQVNATIPYAVTCDVVSSKTVDLVARYALEGTDVTNEYVFAQGVSLDAKGLGELPDLMPGTNYCVSVYGRGGETVSPTTAVQRVAVPGPATGLAAAATFTNDPKEFVITGSVTPGLGTTTVYLRWSLNSDALDNLATFAFALGDEGAFEKKVAYLNPTDTLTWDVSVSNAFTSTTYGAAAWSDAQEPRVQSRTETKATTYTWNGASAVNRWDSFANWLPDSPDCYGFPNDLSMATAVFGPLNGVESLTVTPGALDEVKAYLIDFKAGLPTNIVFDMEGKAMTTGNHVMPTDGVPQEWPDGTAYTFRNGTYNFNLMGSGGDHNIGVRFGANSIINLEDGANVTWSKCRPIAKSGHTLNVTGGSKWRAGNGWTYYSFTYDRISLNVIGAGSSYYEAGKGTYNRWNSTVRALDGGVIEFYDYTPTTFDGSSFVADGIGSTIKLSSSTYGNTSTYANMKFTVSNGGVLNIGARGSAGIDGDNTGFSLTLDDGTLHTTYEGNCTKFNVGTHTSDATSLKGNPTMTFKGAAPLCDVSTCDANFGSDTTGLAENLQMVFDVPTDGWKNAPVKCAKNVTIGSNVVFHVNFASETMKFDVPLVHADGTLTVDVKALMDNLVLPPQCEGTLKLYLSADGKTLRARLRRGGFAVIVR